MHFNVDDPIQFDELWHAAGVSKSIAQNWTNGRPFKLLPSGVQAEGKGSRNIYAVADAYFMALLSLLKERGLSTVVLERIVEFYNTRFANYPPLAIQHFAEENHWWSFSKTDIVEMYGPVQYDPDSGTSLTANPLQLHDLHDLMGLQVAVNLDKLRAQVNQRWTKYRDRLAKGREKRTRR